MLWVILVASAQQLRCMQPFQFGTGIHMGVFMASLMPSVNPQTPTFVIQMYSKNTFIFMGYNVLMGAKTKSILDFPVVIVHPASYLF